MSIKTIIYYQIMTMKISIELKWIEWVGCDWQTNILKQYVCLVLCLAAVTM